MRNENSEVRIARYLAGEADAAERAALEESMATDPSLREAFLYYQKIWSAKSDTPSTGWNVEDGWQRFKEHHQTVIALHNNNRSRILSWAVAAALMLALGAAVFLWMERRPVEYAYDPARKDAIALQDGSKIFLNEGSSAKVYSFRKDSRNVELDGEAFFEVTPDAAKPFTVKAGKTLTEVVGTSFNISHSQDRTSIYVSSGKVIFRSVDTHEQSIALTSGEAAIFMDNRIDRVPNPSPNMQAWHTRELKFLPNMPFGDIISDIGSYFKHEFEFENQHVKNCPVTIPLSFKEPRLDIILESVVAAVNASYTIEGNKCIIRGGENCF